MHNVAFASTNYGPLWRPAVESWLRVVAVTSRTMSVQLLGKLGGCGITDRMYTHSAENKLVEDFMNTPGATHLFMTESDMILPDDAILKLLELDKPVSSGIYFLRNGNGQPCLYQKLLTSRSNPYCHSPVTSFPTDAPFRVDCPGLGCVLFKREVFEKLEFPFFDLKEAMYGSDMYFFSKVKWAGIEVWADPRVMCDQIDYKIATFQDYQRRLKDDPKFAGSGAVLGSSARDYCPAEAVE